MDQYLNYSVVSTTANCDEEVQIVLSRDSPEDIIVNLRVENEQLKTKIKEQEEKILALEKDIDRLRNPPKREKKPVEEYNEFKSNGCRKARPADSIRSYDDFYAMQQYFLRKNKIRDWALWTIGVALGLRISDLLKLKFNSFLNEKLEFRRYVILIEQKTGKTNRCLMTDAVVDAVTKYLDSIKWHFELDDYFFKSDKTGSKMCEEYGWRIISNAGKALNFPLVIGSHTMRKSFANIAACVDKSSVDMNAITKIQGLLNHSDQKTTMRYLGTFKDMYDKARIAVSDFILGKSGINKLEVGSSSVAEEIMEKLDSIELFMNGSF